MFKKFRILILLIVLVSVALTTWRANTRLTEWKNSVHVAIYPIAADDTPATQRYISQLTLDDFSEISGWAQEESDRYGLTVLQPVVIHLAPATTKLPPLPPGPGKTFDTLLWSLNFRWWAMNNDKVDGPKPNVRLFVLFHDPERTATVPHSTGLSKGQLGLIHAFASRKQRKQNLVVIAHEMLHTFGATDKYDLGTLQPIYPSGYAEPDKAPRLPQRFAEIMGGRIPISEQQADIPGGLSATLIGPETAREIGMIGGKR